MPESSGKQTPPNWLGFHRDGLFTVFILDCLWMFIEVTAGATVVGIPAIPFIAFLLFGLSFWIVFSKQRILGDNYFQATWKSVVLGTIAGLPFSVFFTMLFVAFAVINKVLPQTKGIGVRLPTLDHHNLGKFTSEFKEIEELLKQAVQQIDSQQSNLTVNENIKFLKKKGIIPTDLAKSLHEIRKVRNSITHETLEIADVRHLRLLRKCREEIEVICEKISKSA